MTTEVLTRVYEPPLTMVVCSVPFATGLGDGHEVSNFNLANSRRVGLLYHSPYCRPVERRAKWNADGCHLGYRIVWPCHLSYRIVWPFVTILDYIWASCVLLSQIPVSVQDACGFCTRDGHQADHRRVCHEHDAPGEPRHQYQRP